MTARRFTATLEAPGPGAVVVVPFAVKEVFGSGRAPVTGTINDHPFRTTTMRYGGTDYLGFRRELREAAGVEIGDDVDIELEPDTDPRRVAVPDDLASALASSGLRERFDSLSFTHRREYVEWIEEAKREDTRSRRVGQAVERLGAGKKQPR